ncbi:ABC transporter permease [Chitinophagales bacterium]|jgi:lipoprotein-releasing system permease protein|nr:ABC transporter permease [Chitinophagales bacterium]
MSNFKIILSITRIHLLTRFKQTSIAALGVTFGIGTFIILVSFMTGLNSLLDGLVLNRTPHVRVYNEIKPSSKQAIEFANEYAEAFHVIHSIKPKLSQTRIHNALPMINAFLADERVKGISPQCAAQVFYLAGSLELNGRITGINVEEEVGLFNFQEYVVEGKPEDLIKTSNGVLLGAGIAKKMSLHLGDRIQVNSSSGGRFALKIVGIFQSGLAEIDDVQSYVNLRTAQTFLGEGKDYISDINIKLWDMEEAPSMAKEIEAQFNVSAIDIKTANAQFDTGTSIRNLITYAVSITLLVVAGFGIYNILNMLIYEKMNDIAILKATGFSGRDVQWIFLSQAFIIGLIGGILGLLLGFVVSVMIDNTPFVTDALPTITTYPIDYNPMYYIIGIVFALSSTFFAGYLPAKKAKNIDPVDIIRGQ